MATRTDILQIRLTTDGDGRVKASLAGVGNEMEGLDRQTKKAERSAISLGQVLGALATSALIKNTIDTVVQFEKLEASLRTVTGSAKAATAEFDKLTDFTAKTPFQVEEVVGAFIKLKAMGLDPSMEALTAYGNTASAMGKSLDQMIEAVADAATGEFERLKEFGIRASQQGDQVSFTFQGVTTTVGKNAAEIEAYLRNIGQTEFAGAMDEQMGTLGGALSNLKDSASALMAAIGEAGLSAAVKGLAGLLGDLAKVMTAAVNPTDANVKRAGELGEIYKFLSFALFRVKQEFLDLGDILGAFGAIVASVVTGNFDAVDTILEARKAKREQMLKDEADFVARMEGVARGTNGDTAQTDTQQTTPPAGGGQDDPMAVYSAAFDEQLRQRYERLSETLRAEEDLERISYENRLMLIEDAYVSGIIPTEEVYKEQLQAIEEEHQARLTDINAKGVNDRLKAEQDAQNKIDSLKQGTLNAALGFMRTMAAEHKGWAIAAIALEKGLAIAEASMNTSVAYTKALNIDPTGALSARVAALGAAQIALIAATGLMQASQVGAGGAAPGSSANPVYTQPTTAPGIPQGTDESRARTTIQIVGDVYDVDRLVDLMAEGLYDGIANKDVLIIPPNSRQARELGVS